jgi:penicillin amidase
VSLASGPTSPGRRAARIAVRGLVVVVLLLAAAVVWTYVALRRSLPALDGERVVASLQAPVRVERDSLGVPTVRGESRADVARALGFLHAQERFFQMDLLRRRAAGEIAELVGSGAVAIDREARRHRFRKVAERVEAAATAEDRTIVVAYADGVNAGLAALGARPPEYLLLGVTPTGWKPEDCVLAALAMFMTLHDAQGRRESDLGVLYDTLPKELADFLAPAGTEWDAPLDGGRLPSSPLPAASVVDLRAPRAKAARLTSPVRESADEEGMGEAAGLGSNNWAVAAAHTTHGGALLADDMHLGIAVPNTWYRTQLVWKDGDVERRMIGVTLPGTPAVVVGSNTNVAWGFTNAEGDWIDLVVLETDPKDSEVYATPDGPRRFAHDKETIKVKGGADESVDVVSTRWGPVIDKDHRGRPRALHWTAYEPEGVNFGLTQLERAGTLDEAIAAANRAGIPPQNFVCADRTGRIGWTVMGAMPRRVGYDGRRPVSWADGSRRWDGWLSPDEHPRVVDPPGGRIWTANNRIVGGADAIRLGETSFDLGARAGQIRDDLLRLDKATEGDMLKVQLDDRALFLERWRDLLLRSLTPEAVAGKPGRAELRALAEAWGGRAAVDSAGYRLVRAFRLRVQKDALSPLVAPAQEADERFELSRIPRTEGPLWTLVTERPVHLLDPRFASWDELLLSAADAVIDEHARLGPRLAERTWGERNTARIRHPLSRAVPSLARFLDMPAEPLPGDSNMPRFQSPESGASERLAVSPGREAEGLFHMPSGQSGHPLSPHYRDGHEAWARGKAMPFLPGPTVHTLTLAAR